MGDSRLNKHSRAQYWRACLCLSLVVLTLCLFATIAAQGANTQTTRRLPKAGFQVMTSTSPGGGLDPLPSSMGMHLSPGLDRGPTDKGTRYDPGEPSLNMAVVRWEPHQMPLLIWISPGLMLPPCPFDEIQSTRVDYVASLLSQPGDAAFGELKVAPGWTPEVNDQVAAGIEEWRQFENEGLFRFAFTDDPHNANILIFFCGGFSGGNAPGGIAVGGITSAQVYTLEQAHSTDKRHKPVVIELSSLINSTPERMIGASAHEFGHALGIKAHSPYRDDIMYVDRVVNQLSAGDKSTIRWLYHQPPGYVL